MTKTLADWLAISWQEGICCDNDSVNSVVSSSLYCVKGISGFGTDRRLCLCHQWRRKDENQRRPVWRRQVWVALSSTRERAMARLLRVGATQGRFSPQCWSAELAEFETGIHLDLRSGPPRRHLLCLLDHLQKEKWEISLQSLSYDLTAKLKLYSIKICIYL